MGDLERMGRELKCPICLSLLDSAVSLTCNHLFCNSCILKSMKSASDCPVCKIPFTRREVRPAPHMDNLVTIYKNMEAASGFNIFVTQNNQPLPKSPDEDKECEGDGDTSKMEAGGTSENHGGEKNTRKRKKSSRKNAKTRVKSSGSDIVKPTFPAKKRVQVPQNILDETPLKNSKLGDSLRELDREGTEEASVMENKRPLQIEKDDNIHAPFFWLREEENNDKLSQRSDEDQFIDGPTPIPLSFSDLKDSDDENPSKEAPLDVVQNKVSVDLFDSELFEWTQRPCSPELFSSPVKTQVEDSCEIDENQQELLAASENLETNNLRADAGNLISENHKEGNKLADVLPPSVSSPQIQSSDVLNGKKKSTKRSRKARGKAMQVEENKEELVAGSEKLETHKLIADAGNSVSKNHKEGNELDDLLPLNVSSPQIQSSDVLNGIKKSKKRSRKASGKVMQVEENCEELIAASEKLETNKLSADAGNSISKNHKQGNKLADVLPLCVSSPQIQSSDVLNGIKKSTKRSRKARGKAMQGQIGEQENSIDGEGVDPNMPLKASREQASDNKHKSSNLGKTNRRGKRVSFDTSINPTPQTTCTVSNMSGVLSDGELTMAKNSCTSPSKQENGKHIPQEIGGRHHLKRSGKQKLDYVQVLAEDLSSTQSPTHEFAGFDSSLQMNNSGNASNRSQRKNKISRKSSSSSKESRSTKKLKLSSDCISKSKTGEEIQPNESILQGPDASVLNETSKEKHRPLMDERILRKCESHVKKYQCAFCLLSEESEASGPMVHYFDGKPVPADYEGGSKVIHCHRNCTEWAPNVYFEDDNNAINLEAEISRSRRIKCSFCGTKGAALGCYEKSCRKSFHVPCAKWTSQCRWDMENFVMLCPLHASSKLPYESSGSQQRSKKYTGEGPGHGRKHETKSQTRTAHGSYKKVVLCCSALSMQERDVVSEFERATKVTVLKNWDSSVTHIIAAVDENGACRRTLKVLLGILEGKWILNIDWIKACMKEMEPIDEERYEINLDIHGIRDGPRLGRLRALNKQPKLFDGYKFYFMGDFMLSYKGFLQDIVISAGGLVLHRKPVPADHPHQTLIIYSLELPNKCNPSEKDSIFSRRQRDAEVLASSTGSKVASNTWILNCIAACKLQCLAQ